VLLVSMPLVSNTGPLPEVFGAGTFTPFSRMQVANFASAAWKAGLLKRARLHIARASRPSVVEAHQPCPPRHHRESRRLHRMDVSGPASVSAA
jgi:hypothetical protein